MSSRQIRKLQQQRELQQAKLREEAAQQQEEEEEEEEEEEDHYPAPVSKASLFASLATLKDNENEDENENEDDNTERKAPEESESEQDTLVAAPKKSKKSKKKKKKGKGKAAEAKAEPSSSKIDHATDEIDTALRELNLKAQNTKTATATEAPKLDPEYERVCKLLGINTQHLKVANEMKNLFGRTAIESHDDAGGAAPGRRGRRLRAAQRNVDLETALKGNHAPGKGLPELTLRRNIFIQGKDDWPRASTGGLTMEVADDLRAVDGTVEFKFVHDQAYENLQTQFSMYVEMGDPQNLIGLLVRNPYHISLLLQVSKVAKDQGDHALSSDLVERALFTFARASLSLFATKLSEGKARLDFARPENRELWLAGYQYIKSLMMKGTYRTALEWAKLLLSLDPEDDPYCMVLMLHNLALRAHEFEFLITFTNHPMFGPQRPTGKHSAASLALASLNLKRAEECRKMLATAITFLPWLFCKLFQELNISDVPASVWGKLPRTAGETLFTEIYIRQAKDLWNTPEATALLVEVAHSIQSVDVDSIEKIKDSDITLNVARYVYLDNTPALMALVPPALLHRQPNSDSDPLPPAMDENIFSHPSQRLPFLQEESRGGLGGAFAGHFDPIAALRMLVPGWTGNGGPEDEEAIDRNGLRQILDEGLGRAEANRDPAAEDQGQGAGSYGLNQLSRLYRLLFGDRPPEAGTPEAALVGGDDDGDEMPALVDADDLSDEDEDEFYEAEWGLDDGRLHSDESDGYDENGIDDDDAWDHR